MIQCLPVLVYTARVFQVAPDSRALGRRKAGNPVRRARFRGEECLTRMTLRDPFDPARGIVLAVGRDSDKS